VATLLPRAAERVHAIVENLGALWPERVALAREQLRTLVGEIRLDRTAGGALEAELIGCYEGLFKLTVGGSIKNVVGCGGSILAAFRTPVRIPLSERVGNR
jgi:hypothetical protein